MGRSQTINCIGQGKEQLDGNGGASARIYDANNKMEISQQIEKAKKEGDIIVGWYAQTKTGCRTLGTYSTYEIIPTKEIKLPKLVACPICNGQGMKGKGSGFMEFCVVCNGSGITKSGYWNGWREWQLEEMRAKFA